MFSYVANKMKIQLNNRELTRSVDIELYVLTRQRGDMSLKINNYAANCNKDQCERNNKTSIGQFMEQ